MNLFVRGVLKVVLLHLEVNSLMGKRSILVLIHHFHQSLISLFFVLFFASFFEWGLEIVWQSLMVHNFSRDKSGTCSDI